MYTITPQGNDCSHYHALTFQYLEIQCIIDLKQELFSLKAKKAAFNGIKLPKCHLIKLLPVPKPQVQPDLCSTSCPTDLKMPTKALLNVPAVKDPVHPFATTKEAAYKLPYEHNFTGPPTKPTKEKKQPTILKPRYKTHKSQKMS
jgi:hypothetical protein